MSKEASRPTSTMSMLSHLRFHRRGASNPTPPAPPQSDHGSLLPSAPPIPTSQTQQGTVSYLGTSQPTVSNANRASSPYRSKTKSLLLPSSKSSRSEGPVFAQDATADGSSGRKHSASASVSGQQAVVEKEHTSSFIGGVQLLNFQNRRTNTAPVATKHDHSSAMSPPAVTLNTLSRNPLPPIDTRPDLDSLPHRNSMPSQSPSNHGQTNSGLSPYTSNTPGAKSPSFVTPTDRKTNQEMMQQLTMADASATSPLPSGMESKSTPPPKKTKGITFLRPVSTLLLRRKANNSVPDLRPLGKEESEFSDPRIRGTRVHDFSAPRPRPTPHSAVAPPVLTAPAVSPLPPRPTTATAQGETLPGLMARGLSGSASTSNLRGVGPVHMAMATGSQKSRASTGAATIMTSSGTITSNGTDDDFSTGQNVHADIPEEDGVQEQASVEPSSSMRSQGKTGRSRNISISEISLKSSISRRMKSTSSRFSFDMIGAAKQEKLLEEKHRQRHGDIEEPEPPNAFMEGDDRFEDFDPDFDYEAMMDDDYEEDIPGGYEEDAIEEEDEDLWEYEGTYGKGGGGLGHLTLEDMKAAEQKEKEAKETEAKEKEAKEQQVATQPSSTPPIPPQPLPEPTFPASPIIEQIVETRVPPNIEDYSAFDFMRSPPVSGSLGPGSAGLAVTPRDSDGNIIGFAYTKDTPQGPSPTFQPPTQETAEPYVRINSPLSSCGSVEPDAVPLDQQEMFKLHAPATERLGALADEEKAFDQVQENEFADEFITDEFVVGDDKGFDESLFDLDDTDEYGRPIPGAFAEAQRMIMKAKGTEGEPSTGVPATDQNDTAGEVSPLSDTDQATTGAAISASPHTPETSPGPSLPPIMIPTFVPIKQAQGPMADVSEASISNVRGIGPETDPQDVLAYQAALAAATQQAADDGKFRRESWDADPTYEDDVDDNGLAGYEDDEIGGYEDEQGGGFNMADYENDDLDNYGMDDDNWIEEANDMALANDDDGWYRQEFGNQLPGGSKYQYSHGGYFGPAGGSNVNRTVSGRVVREPNLTPITERSEYSNRNSLMSLHGFTSPGLAQLAMMADNDDNMTLSALLRLRGRKWNGSANSSIHGSPREEASPRGSWLSDGDGMGGFGTPGSALAMGMRSPLAMSGAVSPSYPAHFVAGWQSLDGVHSQQPQATPHLTPQNPTSSPQQLAPQSAPSRTSVPTPAPESGLPKPREFPLVTERMSAMSLELPLTDPGPSGSGESSEDGPENVGEADRSGKV